MVMLWTTYVGSHDYGYHLSILEDSVGILYKGVECFDIILIIQIIYIIVYNFLPSTYYIYCYSASIFV